jgi:hypothetical protein
MTECWPAFGKPPCSACRSDEPVAKVVQTSEPPPAHAELAPQRVLGKRVASLRSASGSESSLRSHSQILDATYIEPSACEF